MKAAKELDKNPMIGVMLSDTFGNVIGALQWLNAMDDLVTDAFGGEPIESIKFGRHLLAKCCIDALKFEAERYEGSIARVAARVGLHPDTVKEARLLDELMAEGERDPDQREVKEKKARR